MALDIKDIEEQRIMGFIHGEMTSDEETAFKAELQADAELRQKAALLARLSKAMNEVGREQDQALADAMQAVDRNTVERLSESTLPRNKQRWAHWAATAAAIVLLVIGLNWRIDRHRLSTAGREYAASFEWTDVVRGEIEPYEEELGSLFSNIINGKNIEATTNRLHVLYELSMLDEENSYTELSFPIGWYLACAHLQLGERQAAIDQLERLQSHGIDKQICADKVKELLLKIK